MRQRLRMALQILDGIDPRVQHIGRTTYHLTRGSGSLHEKIVVSIHTSNHAVP